MNICNKNLLPARTLQILDQQAKARDQWVREWHLWQDNRKVGHVTFLLQRLVTWYTTLPQVNNRVLIMPIFDLTFWNFAELVIYNLSFNLIVIIFQSSSVLYCCTMFWCAMLCCDVMYCAVLCCDVMWCDVLCCDMMWCAVLCCAVM